MACFRNGWKQKVIILYHMAAATSMSWKMLPVWLPSVVPHGERAGIFIIWAIPCPELGTQRPSSQFLVRVRAVTGHPEHREQPGSRAAHSIWQDQEHPSSAGCIPGTALTKGILEQWPSHKQGLCSVPHSRGDHDTAAKSHCSRHCNCQAGQTASVAVAIYSCFVLNDAPSFIS